MVGGNMAGWSYWKKVREVGAQRTNGNMEQTASEEIKRDQTIEGLVVSAKNIEFLSRRFNSYSWKGICTSWYSLPPSKRGISLPIHWCWVAISFLWSMAWKQVTGKNFENLMHLSFVFSCLCPCHGKNPPGLSAGSTRSGKTLWTELPLSPSQIHWSSWAIGLKKWLLFIDVKISFGTCYQKLLIGFIWYRVHRVYRYI